MINEPSADSKPKKLTRAEIAAGRKRLKKLNQEWLKSGEREKSQESIVESIGTFSSSSLETLPPRRPNPVYSTDSEEDIFNPKPKLTKIPKKKKPTKETLQHTEDEPSTGSIGDLMSLGLLAPNLPEAEPKHTCKLSRRQKSGAKEIASHKMFLEKIHSDFSVSDEESSHTFTHTEGASTKLEANKKAQTKTALSTNSVASRDSKVQSSVAQSNSRGKSKRLSEPTVTTEGSPNKGNQAEAGLGKRQTRGTAKELSGSTHKHGKCKPGYSQIENELKLADTPAGTGRKNR